jgi:hypothetical protein
MSIEVQEKMNERRIAPRVPSDFRVELLDGPSGAAKNMSESGALLSFPTHLDAGKRYIRFLLPLKPITLRIDTVWSKEDREIEEFTYGVRFTDLTGENILYIRESLENKPVIEGQKPPTRIKRFFYNALSLQWNPEKEIDWNAPLGIDDSLCRAMADILSPIIIGEYSAFDGIPPRILSFKDYEIKQYLAAQLVDETRHAEAFDLYLARIHGKKQYRKNLRNVHTLRFFNELKKLDDIDEWIAGLYLTEIMSHVLLNSYAQKVKCRLTQHLFKLILADEARHISFANYYLKEILKNASPEDRKFMAKIPERILNLTEGMVHSYGESGRAFGLDPQRLFEKIKYEFNARFIKNVVREKHDVAG